MYCASRLLLMLAVGCGGYCLAITVALTWPLSGVVILVAGLADAVRRRFQGLTTLGSARWADESDLRRAGLFGAESGLILGRLPSKLAGGVPAAIRALFTRGVGAKQACEGFWAGRKRSNRWVRLPHAELERER